MGLEPSICDEESLVEMVQQEYSRRLGRSQTVSGRTQCNALGFSVVVGSSSLFESAIWRNGFGEEVLPGLDGVIGCWAKSLMQERQTTGPRPCNSFAADSGESLESQLQVLQVLRRKDSSSDFEQQDCMKCMQ